MNNDHKKRASNFEDIKRSFDPAYSYIVIENRAGLGDDKSFATVSEALSALNRPVLSRQICHDQTSGKKMLIVKIDHQEAEEIMLVLLKTSLKKDFNCYVY
jgi:hypothetical protein